MNKKLLMLLAIAGCCLLSGLSLAQENSDNSAEPSLGNVARQQKQRPHTAKKVVGDEDIGPSGLRRVGAQGTPAFTIPSPLIGGYIPATTDESSPIYGRYITKEGHHKIYVTFGPDIGAGCSCAEGLSYAENLYMNNKLPGDGHMKGHGHILFETDTNISGYPARTARVQASGQLEPLQGTIALIAVPEEVMTVACFYPESDAAGASDICDNFIASISINFPEKYIRVENPMNYY
jgi:hypothetical protein